ncbi:hypothetical protein GGER_50470 [Serratia rubidaea]
MTLRRRLLLLFLVLALALLALYLWLKPAHPDALWHIVSQQCLPNQQQHHDPAPARRLTCSTAPWCLKTATARCSTC